MQRKGNFVKIFVFFNHITSNNRKAKLNLSAAFMKLTMLEAYRLDAR